DVGDPRLSRLDRAGVDGAGLRAARDRGFLSLLAERAHRNRTRRANAMMSAAGPRPPWICDESRCSNSRPRVTTRICRRSPLRGAPRRLLASLPQGANYSPSGGSAAAPSASLDLKAESK